MTSPEYPKIRSIDAFPVEISGRQMICLRDPLSYTDQTLLLPESTFFIISFLDGQHSLLDIQAEYMRRYGDLLFREKIAEIVKQLDDHLLLESERFLEYKGEVEKRFADSPVREPMLAGKSYESESAKLRDQLTSYFMAPEGPGEIGDGEAAQTPLIGAIIPHIDYARGGSCYAWAYKEIGESLHADTFVVLGTLHTEAQTPFILTRKGFSTPLGDLETDQEFVATLGEECSFDPFAEEIVHRAEHSLELQMVFLRYVFGNSRPIRVVPILCSSFHEFGHNELPPTKDPEISSFLRSLKRAIELRGEGACVLASADLAHMGPRFGDRSPIREPDLRWIAQEDGQMIEQIEKMDGEAFFEEIRRDRNRRRICGASAIYALLTTVGAGKGRLLKYGQWFDPQGTITYASVGFYR
jgi:AmmeMemoRadiSam system protein B